MSRRRKKSSCRPVHDAGSQLAVMMPDDPAMYGFQSDPGCDSEEHQDMVEAIMLNRMLGTRRADDASTLVLNGDRVRWSCGCTFWV